MSVTRCGHWQKTVVVVVEQSAAEDGRGVVFGRTTGREVWRRKKSGVGEGRRREVGRGGGRGEVKKEVILFTKPLKKKRNKEEEYPAKQGTRPSPSPSRGV